MTGSMGFYRTMVSIYYSKKNFMYIGFVLLLLMMVYFYLPGRSKHGTHYLNPKMNLEVVKPNAAFLPKVVDKDALDADQTHIDIQGLNLKPIPDFVTERSKCPACYGEDLCSEIDSGAIKILVPEDDDDVLKLKGVYNGYWNDQPVVIKRLNKVEEYAKVDAFLCRNASMPADCDVSQAILSASGLVQQEKAFHPEFLRSAWKIMHDRADKLPVAACITEDAILKLMEEFDSDHDKVLSKEEKAKFFMSSVFNPESLILAFAKEEGLKIHFPEILGRCGRIVVTEHAGIPLATYLDKPFKERADLAMMLLGMIFFLQNFSVKWSLVFSDFNFDNFYVKDYNLYIVDAEDMLVTDTEFYKEPREREKKICNHDCMEQFATRLFDYERVPRKEICPLTPGITEQAMYALACERIMSYLPEHRSYSPFKGLLHDPPDEIREYLEMTLRECVSETSVEGRISSVDVLSEMLEKYTDYGNYVYNDDSKDDDWGMDGDVVPDEDNQNGADQQNPQQPNIADNAQAPGQINPEPAQPAGGLPGLGQQQAQAAQNIQQGIQDPQAVQQVQQGIRDPQPVQQVQQGIQDPQPVQQVQQGIQDPQPVQQVQQGIQDPQLVQQVQQGIQDPQPVQQMQQGIQDQQPEQQMHNGIQDPQPVQQVQQSIQDPQPVQQVQQGIQDPQPVQQVQQGIQDPQPVQQMQQGIQDPQPIQQQGIQDQQPVQQQGIQDQQPVQQMQHGIQDQQPIQQNVQAPQVLPIVNNQPVAQNVQQGVQQAADQQQQHIIQQQPVAQNLPQYQPVQQNFPQNQPVQQNVPQNQPVQQNVPQNQPFVQNAPQNQPIIQNIPQNQPVIQNAPQNNNQ